MKTDTWMPFYVADFVADTLHLDREDIGSYLLLILAYWRNGGPLPDDDSTLAKTARMTPREWKEARPTLSAFFQVGDGLWRHKRIDRELQTATEIVNERSRAGKAGAERRWRGHNKGNGKTMAEPSETASQNDGKGMANGMRTQWQNDGPSPSPEEEDQRLTLTSGDSLAQIPTVEEVIAAGAVPGIPEEFCRNYHAVCEEQHRWLVGPLGNQKLRGWQSELVRWWTRDRQNWKPAEKAGNRGVRVEDSL